MSRIKSIPTTTDGACKHYRATTSACTCPDAKTRNGGSYRINNQRVCKHTARMIQQAADRALCAQDHVNGTRQAVAARANRAINNLYYNYPLRSFEYQNERMVDDGLSGFFGYEMKVFV